MTNIIKFDKSKKKKSTLGLHSTPTDKPSSKQNLDEDEAMKAILTGLENGYFYLTNAKKHQQALIHLIGMRRLAAKIDYLACKLFRENESNRREELKKPIDISKKETDDE